jgi:parvulin-like peptidyl-prolyl isomerase
MTRRMCLSARTACGALAVLLCTAAGPEPASPPPSDVIAQAGNVSITAGDVQQLIAHLDPPVRAQLMQNHTALDELVRSQVVRQELLADAAAKQWDQNPDVAYRAKMARESAILDSYLASLTQPDAAYPSDADIAAAYEANKARFVQPRQYHLAQIFLAVPADASAQVSQEAQKKLRALKQSLSRPHADFAAAARQTSQEKQSAANGGDVGWVREDQLNPAIREAVAGLPDNAISDPIRAPDGWHLVKLLGTRPAATATLDEAKDTLVKLLRQQKASENARAYLQQMQAKQPIEINEIELSRLLSK